MDRAQARSYKGFRLS